MEDVMKKIDKVYFEKRANEALDKIKQEDIDFYHIIEDIINNNTVRQMIQYRQHYDTSTFEHCLHVSYISYRFRCV